MSGLRVLLGRYPVLLPALVCLGLAASWLAFAAKPSKKKLDDIEDLEAWFRDQQAMFLPIFPPSEDPFLQTGWPDAIPFDPRKFPLECRGGLLGDIEFGSPVYHVYLIEDPSTREFVIYNKLYEEVCSLAAAAQYDPSAFVLDRKPDLFSGSYATNEIDFWLWVFDPARVQIAATLVPDEFYDAYVASRDEAAALAALDFDGGGMTMMSSGGSYTGLWVSVEGPGASGTNGVEVTVHLPEGVDLVDVFSCDATNYAGTASAWALVATNVATTDVGIVVWTDTSASNQSFRLYTAGDAEADTDEDTLVDAHEMLLYGTDPELADTDNDNLDDDEELLEYDTDPNDADCDSDDFLDGDEITAGTDPWDPDSDDDGMPDGWEHQYGLDPLSGVSSALIAHWRMDEGSGGTISNSVSESYAGTLSNMSSSAWIEGKLGYGLTFDRTNDFVAIGQSPALITNGAFSLSAWVRYPTNVPAQNKWYSILSDYERATGIEKGYWLGLGKANSATAAQQIGFTLGAGVTDDAIQHSSAEDFAGGWVHLVATYDGTAARLCVDGQWLGPVTTSFTAAESANLRLSRFDEASSEHGWQGDMDDVRIYAAALSSNQVVGMYDAMGDPDHDGRTNLEEYEAGLDPTVEDCWPGVSVVLAMDSSLTMDLDLGDTNSMTRLEAAQVAASNFVENLTLTGDIHDLVGVVSFSSNAWTDCLLTNDASAAITALNGLTTSFGTRIDLGIAEAREELCSVRYDPDTRRLLIVLSDGENYPANTAAYVGAAARAAKSDHAVRLVAVALGSGADTNALYEIASEPKSNNYYYATNSASLTAVYELIAESICREYAPVVTITNPTNSQVLSIGTNLTITATATDSNQNISCVEFLEDWAPLGADSNVSDSTFSVPWEAAATGSVTFTAIAYDGYGLTATNSVTVTVTNTVPTVSIATPTNSQTFAAGEDIHIVVEASDTEGAVTGVQFSAGSNVISTDFDTPFSAVWLDAPVGTTMLTAKAWDEFGLSAVSSGITITVTDAPPSVAVFLPRSGSAADAMADVTVGVAATDDLQITQVVVYANGAAIATNEDAVSFSTHANLTESTNQYYAWAWDSGGQSNVSATVTHYVLGQAPEVQILGPDDGDVFASGEPIRISALAEDADGIVTNIQINTNSSFFAESDESTNAFSVSWLDAPLQSNDITAVAIDDDENASTPQTVTIVVESCDSPAALTNFTLSSTNVVGGGCVTGTLQLAGGALAGGQAINLTCTNAAIVIPGSVLVPEDADELAFEIWAGQVPESVSTTIKASSPTVDKVVTLEILGQVDYLVGQSSSGATNLQIVADAGTNQAAHVRLAEAITGPGVILLADTVDFTGTNFSAGLFVGGGGVEGIGISDGLILSSGIITNFAASTNDTDGFTIYGDWFGVDGFNDVEDENLKEFADGATMRDTTILEFGVVPEYDQLTWAYVFGSEEYNTYVGTGYNDVFGFFVSSFDGVTNNVAVLPDGRPVSVDTVNLDNNSELYLNNDNVEDSPVLPYHGPFSTGMDGFTRVLEARANVIPGATNYIKLAIADVLDMTVSSYVIIRAASVKSGVYTVLTRDDLGFTNHREMVACASSPTAYGDSAIFDLQGIDGTVEAVRLERAGTVAFNSGNRFHLQFGAASALGNASYGAAAFSPSNGAYKTAWSLPQAFCKDGDDALGTQWSLQLADHISSLCGASHLVADVPHGQDPHLKNILTVAVRGEAVVEQGRCLDLALHQGAAPVNGTWDILFRNRIIASSGRPNGWDVEEDHNWFEGFTMTVPESAEDDSGYVVRVRQPGWTSGKSAPFAVLMADSLRRAPVLKPLVVSSDTVGISSNSTVDLTVSLDGAAPAGGAHVTFDTDRMESFASVPSLVVIPAGAVSVTTNMAIQAPGAVDELVVLASYNGYRKVRVRAVDACSNPTAPTIDSIGQDADMVVVTWQSVGEGITYDISRSTSVAATAELLFSGLSDTNFIDADPVILATNYYEITAHDDACSNSSETNIFVAIPHDPPAPWIVPHGGTFHDEVQVTITNTLSDSRIFWTIDGSIPDGSSTSQMGSATFTLTSNAVLRALATNSLYQGTSTVASAAFTIVAPEGIGCGTTNEASLGSGGASCTVAGGGWYYSTRFSVTNAAAGQTLDISVSSSDFDTLAYLFDSSGTNIVAANDDRSLTDSDSSIIYTVPSSGDYILEVTSKYVLQTGDFDAILTCREDPGLHVSTNGAQLFSFDLLDLGTGETNETFSTSLVVGNSGLGTLDLSSVAAFPASYFSVSPSSATNIETGATTNLTVEFTSASATEAFGILVVSNNVPDEGPLYLNLYAVAGTPPAGGPQVQITAPQPETTFTAGDSVTITASVSPADHIEEVQFWRGFLLGTTAGSGESSVQFSWTAEVDEQTNGLVAVAVDDTGRMAVSEEVPITVTWNQEDEPVAHIESPADATDTSSGFDSVGLATVRDGLLSVTGRVYHVVSNVCWKLELLDAEGTVLRNFTPGTLEAGFTTREHAAGYADAFALANCDLTTLRNGVYELKLVVRGNNRVSTDSVRFRLESNLKIGQFSFTEQDLVIPVSGMPLSVLRTYDSLNPEKGAFGYGWTYSINDLDVKLYDKRQTVTLSDGTPVSLRVGGPRDVTLTLPDGRRTTFTFGWQVGHFVAAPKFYAAPGVRATLETLDGDLYDKVNGRWMTDATAAFDWYEFPGYKLTLEDGARFIIEREVLGRYTATGGIAGQIGAQTYGEPVLTRVELPGGDRILIGSDAYNAEGEVVFQVAHRNATNETTRVVDFKRNHLGLITEISDPNGRAAGAGAPPAVKYQYDDAGHLVRVLRLTDHAAGSYTTNQYFYENGSYPHYLTRIVDGRGVDVARSLYDDAGRLFAVIDAAGKTNEFRHGLDANTNYVGAVNEEVVVDRMGHSTFHGYDARGNVVYTIDPQGGATLRTYDDEDQVLSVTDPLSNTTHYAYDWAGNRTRVVDPMGRTNLFTYDSRGRLLTETDPAGNVTANSFDAAGNLTNTVHRDAQGNPVGGSSSEYQNGRLVATRSFTGEVTAAFTYDAAGNLTGVTNAEAFARGFVYDLNGNQLGSSYVGTNEDGQAVIVVTTNVYDAVGRVVMSVDAFGHTNSTVYNAIGKQSFTIDRYGHTNSFLYDARGSLIQTASPLSTNLTVYDANARPTFTTSRNGVVGTETEYDALGRVLRTIRYTNTWVSLSTNGSGQVRSAVASWGTPLSTNATVYYANGWVKERIGPDGAKTTYTYWPDGQTRTVTDALGNRTVYTYDEASRRASMLDAEHRSTWFQYDALGRQVATVFADGSTVSNLYNQLGRRVAEIDQAGLRTDFGYNVAGLLTSVTKPEVLEPHGGTNAAPTWVYNYDAQGRLLVVTDPNGHSTTNTFNEFGQQYSHELQMGQVSSNLYYTNGIHAGRLWKEYDFKGQVAEHFYDDFGRTTSTFYFAESSSDPAMGVLFNFNGLGQLAKVIETHGIDATETNYPSAFLPPVTGRWRLPWPNVPVVWLLVALFLALAIFLQTLETVLRCRIARLSRALSLVLPGSAGLSEAQRQPHPRPPRRHHHPVLAPHYRFISLALILALVFADPTLHRLWTAHAQSLPPTGEVRITTFTYDFEGRLIKVTAPEGTIHYGYDLVTGRHTSTRTDYTHVEYGYDLLGRLQTVRVLKRNGDPVDETTTYTYTPVGSREATYYPNGVSTHYQYDTLDRLTNLTHRAADQSLLASYAYTLGDTGRRTGATEIILDEDDTTYATNTITWQYDGLYRLTNETFNGVSTSYEYDLVGNRLEKSDGAEIITYAYNADDQLLSETNGTQVTTYAYNDNGSLTNRTIEGVSTNAYAYNQANRLASVTTDAGTTSFLYNHQGVRVQSKGYGGTRHFLVDHRNPTGYAQVLEESSTLGGSPVLSYTIGDDVLAQCLGSGNPQWLLYDGHGSTRQLLGDAGSVAAQYDFDAYGVAAPALPSTPDTTLLYAGEMYDSVLDAYYLRARFYDPGTGRFTRRDPLEIANRFDPQSLHKYMAFHSDPVNGIDPSGEFTLVQLVGVVAGLALAAALLYPVVRGAVRFLGNSAALGSAVTYAPGMEGEPDYGTATDLLLRARRAMDIFGTPGATYYWDSNVGIGSDMISTYAHTLQFIQTDFGVHYYACVPTGLTKQLVLLSREWSTGEFSDAQRGLILLHELVHAKWGAGEPRAHRAQYIAEVRYRARMNGWPLPIPPDDPQHVIFSEDDYDRPAWAAHLSLQERRSIVREINTRGNVEDHTWD